MVGYRIIPHLKFKMQLPERDFGVKGLSFALPSLILFFILVCFSGVRAKYAEDVDFVTIYIEEAHPRYV